MKQSILENIINKADKELIPFTALLEVTRKCNLHCEHCYRVEDKSRHEMAGSKISSLIGELRDAGCLFLTLTGGEPLLRPDFLDICQEANSANVAINIFTNGTLITEEVAHMLSILNILDIAISIYGATDKTHDNITLNNGSYRKAIRGALTLKKHGLSVRFKYIMMKDNIADYDKMLNLSKELGIHYDLDPVITPCDNGDMAPTKLRLSNENLKKIYKSVTDNLPSEIGNSRFVSCSFGRSHCAISAYGDVYPCIQLPVSAGNLMEKSFYDIWNNSEWLKEIRDFSLDKIDACRTCSSVAYCRRCPGLNYIEEQSLYQPSRETCRHARIIKSVCVS